MRFPLNLPNDVIRDGFFLRPTWEELRLDWHRQQQALAKAEVERIEAAEQRAWLTQQIQKMAAIALEIEKDKRMAALAEAQDRVDAWWAEEVAKEEQARIAVELEKLE